ncbi:MAG: hypothetical protein AAF974_13410 [Cyanobacteria bacterium P01_E01_bin.34]
MGRFYEVRLGVGAMVAVSPAGLAKQPRTIESGAFRCGRGMVVQS